MTKEEEFRARVKHCVKDAIVQDVDGFRYFYPRSRITSMVDPKIRERQACSNEAHKRIREAEVSIETKTLAKSLLPEALRVLGNLSVFWDEDSIILESDRGGIEIWTSTQSGRSSPTK
jgi:hypothetical protein